MSRAQGRTVLLLAMIVIGVLANYNDPTLAERAGTREVTPFFEWKLYPRPAFPDQYAAPRALGPGGIDLGLELAPHLTKEETYSLLRSMVADIGESPEEVEVRFGCLLELERRPAGTYLLVRRTVDGYSPGDVVTHTEDEVVLSVDQADHDPESCR